MKFKIDSDYSGVRLDKFLRKTMKDTALGDIFKKIRTGKVKVNGKKKKQDYRLLNDDEVEIFGMSKLVKEEEFVILTEREKKRLAEWIEFENNEILIINKPWGLVVHKGTGHKYGLIEMLKSYYKSNNIAFINRIDKNTSGLVIAAKTLPGIRKYSEYMRNGYIEKYYYALSKGKTVKDSFVIDLSIEKQEDRVRVSDGGKESSTVFNVIRQEGDTVLLEAKLITGRTHQIRVHLSEYKLPIIGDYKYGVKRGSRMCLFSHRISVKEADIDVNLDIPGWFWDQ